MTDSLALTDISVGNIIITSNKTEIRDIFFSDLSCSTKQVIYDYINRLSTDNELSPNSIHPLKTDVFVNMLNGVQLSVINGKVSDDEMNRVLDIIIDKFNIQ